MKENTKRESTILKLCELLEKAEQVLRTRSNLPMLYTRFNRSEEFADWIQQNREKVKAGDRSALQEISLVFAPTSEWDDCVGETSLPNEIYRLLNELN